MENQFTRINALLTLEEINKINNATVCIVGLGGVGSVTTETLARCGIRKFILCDFDTINITNCNRQIIANMNTINLYKADVLKDIIVSINKDAEVKIIKDKFNENSNLFDNKIDFLVDAIDDVNNKILLIKKALENNINFISSMGTAKKFDLKKLSIVDINKTEYDPLAKCIRQKLRKENLKVHFDCLSSTEEIKECEMLGSYMPVTATAGLMIADYVIKKIIK